MKRCWMLGLLAWIAVPLLFSPAWAQAPFYEGKTITVVLGATGGSLELATRIVTRHIGKYIPGNPTVILQHMTGAAHLEIGRASCRERV